MRGWLIIAMVGAAFITVPASVQARGGAHAAPARGFSSTPARSAVGFRSSGTFRSRGVPDRSLFFRRGRPFFGSPGWPYYPGWYYGDDLYSPFWDTPDYSGAATSAYSPQEDQAEDQEQQELNQLHYEVELLREQQAAAIPPMQPAPPQQRAQSEGAPPPPTTLVFRDGKTEQVQDYAIAGKTLWVFNGGQMRKILLSDLDLPSTRKTNEEHGVEFSPPQQ